MPIIIGHRRLAVSAGILFEKNRLERNLSTANFTSIMYFPA